MLDRNFLQVVREVMQGEEEEKKTLGDFRWGGVVYSNTDYDPTPHSPEHMFVSMSGSILSHPNNYSFLIVCNYTEIQDNGSGQS